MKCLSEIPFLVAINYTLGARTHTPSPSHFPCSHSIRCSIYRQMAQGIGKVGARTYLSSLLSPFSRSPFSRLSQQNQEST
jgi:hypothetical protein